MPGVDHQAENLRKPDIVLAGWSLGVTGAWHAMTADLWVRASLVVYRFLHGGWKRVEV